MNVDTGNWTISSNNWSGSWRYNREKTALWLVGLVSSTVYQPCQRLFWVCFYIQLTQLMQLLLNESLNNFLCRIAVTKLDILDNLEELKIGVGYKLNGKALTRYPASIADLSNVEVEYVTLPGWKTSIANVRTWNELPQNAKKYIKFMQDYLQVPSKLIILEK